ncbi:MAG: protein kinase [Microbacteriaceae bacterium]
MRGSSARGEAASGGPVAKSTDQSHPTQPRSSGAHPTAGASCFEPEPEGSDPQRLVGYRVVRMIGRGTRATVYLGHRPATPGAGSKTGSDGDADCIPDRIPDREPPPPTSTTAESDELVVLKVFHPATGQPSIDLEVRALTATCHQHLLGLTDVATAPGGGVVLVLPYLAGGTLAQLLERRSRLQPGEAVNIVAPIITAVMHLYASGFRHVSLNSSRVRFQAHGTPVIAGFGRVRAIPVDAGASRSLAHGEESEIWQSLVALAEEILTHVRSDDPGDVRLSLPSLARRDPDSTLVQATEALVAELFEWAEPQAVAREDPATSTTAPNQASRQIPGRTHRDEAYGAGRAERADSDDGGSGRAGRPWLGVFHLPAQLHDSMERALELNPVHVLKDTWGAVSARTRRMLVAGVLVFAVTSAAVLLAVPRDHPVTALGSGPSAGQREESSPGASKTSSAPMVSPEGDQTISAAERSKIVAADPMVAVEALLAIRQRCLRGRSLVCLLDVVQENTALMDADRAGLRDGPGGNGAAAETSSPVAHVGPQTHIATLVERSGDAALISWEPRAGHDNQPISVLMMRAETGWRLREIFDY